MAFLCIPRILLHQGGCTNVGVHEAHTQINGLKRAPKTHKWSIRVLTVLPKRYSANNYSECTRSSDTQRQHMHRFHYKTRKSPSFISWADNAWPHKSEPTGTPAVVLSSIPFVHVCVALIPNSPRGKAGSGYKLVGMVCRQNVKSFSQVDRKWTNS